MDRNSRPLFKRNVADAILVVFQVHQHPKESFAWEDALPAFLTDDQSAEPAQLISDWWHQTAGKQWARPAVS